MKAHERTAQCPAAGPPSAAQEHQEQARADVPQHAAEPALGGEALPERGRVVHIVPFPRPLPSSFAVRYGAWTRQGSLRPPSARDASASGGVALSPAAGTSSTAACNRRAQPSTTTARQGHAKLWSPTLK